MRIGSIDKDGNIIKDFYMLGYVFKDTEAYKNKVGTCYVSELSDTKYSYDDFIRIAEGDEDIADMIFEHVNWHYPEAFLDGMISMKEIKRCKDCKKLYLTNGKYDMECPKCGKDKGHLNNKEKRFNIPIKCTAVLGIKANSLEEALEKVRNSDIISKCGESLGKHWSIDMDRDIIEDEIFYDDDF